MKSVYQQYQKHKLRSKDNTKKSHSNKSNLKNFKFKSSLIDLFTKHKRKKNNVAQLNLIFSHHIVS